MTAQLIEFDITTHLTENYLELIRNLLEIRETKIILWQGMESGEQRKVPESIRQQLTIPKLMPIGICCKKNVLTKTLKHL